MFILVFKWYSDLYQKELKSWAQNGRPFPETMAIDIDRFISSLTPDPATGRELIACCHKHGIEQAINLAVLSSEDLCVLCEGSSEATFVLAAAAQAAASRLTEGWAMGKFPACGEGIIRGRAGLQCPIGPTRTFTTRRTTPECRKFSPRRILSCCSYYSLVDCVPPRYAHRG